MDRLLALDWKISVVKIIILIYFTCMQGNMNICCMYLRKIMTYTMGTEL